MLKNVKKACREKHDGGKKYCSGDGNICDETRAQSQNTFISLHCKDCLKECMKYKKWIDIKFEEFKEQQNKYGNELQKLNGNSNGGGDNNCCTEKKKKNTAAEFLKELKHCKNGQNNSEEKGTEEDEKNNEINFDKPENTFNPSTYCKACPVYGVNCNNKKSECVPISEETYKSTKGSRGENNDDKTTSVIEVLMLDRKGKDKTNDLDNDCKINELLKYAGVQKWECQKKKGIDQCNLTNPGAKTDDDKNIWFNEFFQRWLRDFVRDYNILKGKIKACIKNENEKEKEKSHKCIQGCDDKCECVKQWLDKKSTEWDEMKKHYEKHSNDDNETIAFRVKSYFREQLHFDNQATKAQEVVETPCEKQQLWGCT
ncbi:hypothetical protein PFTANZ_05861, partial [Plasmodium falciparum Tanzania (2000708)]